MVSQKIVLSGHLNTNSNIEGPMPNTGKNLFSSGEKSKQDDTMIEDTAVFSDSCDAAAE